MGFGTYPIRTSLISLCPLFYYQASSDFASFCYFSFTCLLTFIVFSTAHCCQVLVVVFCINKSGANITHNLHVSKNTCCYVPGTLSLLLFRGWSKQHGQVSCPDTWIYFVNPRQTILTHDNSIGLSRTSVHIGHKVASPTAYMEVSDCECTQTDA